MNIMLKAGVLVLVLAGGVEWLTWPDGNVVVQYSADDGAALFRTKGCVTCHAYQGIDKPEDWDNSYGPDLTNYRNDPAFLRRWLDDPAAVRPVTQTPNGMPNQMPDLDLSPTEIEQLIAFLNGEE